MKMQHATLYPICILADYTIRKNAYPDEIFSYTFHSAVLANLLKTTK